MKIAPEIDKLMWTVAESGDANALADFQMRFPELSHEVSQRTELVQKLRNARELHLSEIPRPQAFVPTTPARTTVRYRPAGGLRSPAVVIALCSGIAVALACYIGMAVRSNNDSGPKVATIAWPASVPKPANGCLPTAAVVSAISSKAETPTNAAKPNGTVKIATADVTAAPLQLPADVKPVGTASEADPLAKPQQLKMRQVPLQAALRALASECGVSLDIAPEVKNPTVDADYEATSAMEILQDLGRKHGFSALKDGKDKVLILPVANGG